MRRFIGALLATALAAGLGSLARADDDKDPKAILDKAVKALGGEENLAKAKAATWKSKGKLSFGGNDSELTSETTVQGIDHYRLEFEGDFGGNKAKGVVVLAGDKGWRDFGGNKMELDKDALANEKRAVYLVVAPVTLLPLRDKGFKVEVAAADKVGDKPAVALKVTGPDGKDFTLAFDKESGLPVKLTAKVLDFQGNEFTQETTFADYKDFGGIKKATKIESKRDGQKFLEQEVSAFKALDKVDPKTFEEPK
jgi:hypothetical protein